MRNQITNQILFILLSIFVFSFSAYAQEKKELKNIVFSQYCFWSAEMKIGQIEGVHKTEAGFYDRHEVTSVFYDPSVISAKQIYERAKSQDVADNVYLRKEDIPTLGKGISNVKVFDLSGYRKAPSSDQKRQLRGTPLEKLKMTDFQRTKTNSFIRVNSSKALSYLTEEQRARLK